MMSVFFRMTIISFIFLVNFSVFASETKGKLLFQGTNVTLLSHVNTDSGLVSKIDKIIDAELFASRIMPFATNEEKAGIKKKASDCKNIECEMTVAKNAGIKLVVISDISFFSGSFKGALKLMDTSTAIPITEVPVTGSLDKAEELYAQMVRELFAGAHYFFVLSGLSSGLEDVKSFKVSDFEPLVDVSAYSSLKNLTLEKYPEETKKNPPLQMTEFHDLKDIKDAELIKAYEDALRADRLGESDPQKAANAWKKVHSLTSDDVLKYFSQNRYQDWFKYNSVIEETEVLKKNIEKEKNLQFFPDQIIKMWQEFLEMKPEEKRAAFAQSRIDLYEQGASSIQKYTTERTTLLKNAENAHKSNVKTMGLGIIKTNKKIEVLIKFLEMYGAVDTDFFFLDNLIDKIPAEKDKELASKNLYNKWTAQHFKNKCDNKDYQACLISYQLFNKIKDEKSSMKLEKEGCEAGIIELCAELAERKLNTNDPSADGIAEKSCFLGSGKGCFVLANFYEISRKKDAKVGEKDLLEISCKRGYRPSCTERQEKKVVKPDKQVEKTDAEKPEKPVKVRKESDFLKSHPYFWYGFSTTIAGFALGGVSLYYLMGSNSKYDSYNKTIDSLYRLPPDSSVEIKEAYMDRALDYKSKGDKYRKIAIGTGIAGGALVITGSVLMFLKKTAKEKPQLTFIPSSEGFMVGAVFRF